MKRRALLFLLSALAIPLVSAAAPEPPAPFALRDGDRVVFYGDSITQEGGYGRFVEEYVRTRFPHWDVRFYNAGVGGDTVRGGGAGPVDVRLERDVIALQPTVVTIMLGMNDGGYKPFDPADARDVRRRLPRDRGEARSGPSPASGSPSSAPRPSTTSRGPRSSLPATTTRSGASGCYVTALGAKEKATVVDFRDPVNAGIAAVLADNPELARQVLPDRVHPGPAGHVVMGAALLRAWNAPSLVTRVEIDAAARRVVAAENTEVSGLEVGGGRSLVDPARPRAAPAPELRGRRDRPRAEGRGRPREPRPAAARRDRPARRAFRAEDRRPGDRHVRGRRAGPRV